MRRITKTLAMAAILCLIFSVTQITAFAADENSVPDVSATNPDARTQLDENSVDQSAVSENPLPAAGTEDIARINENTEGGALNPETGAGNMVIPGVVALIAAATAAIALTGKKR